MTTKKKRKLPRGIALLSVGITLVISGCGGDDSSPAASGSGGSGNTSSGGSSNSSGGSGGNSGGCVFDSECPTGYECTIEGQCAPVQDPSSQCSGTFSHCPGASALKECVQLASDPGHCGACDNACASGENCISGSCTKDCDTMALCGTDCVNVKADNPLHCGACDNACNSGQICTDGTCGCETGKCGDNCTLNLCQGACVDTQTDINNCGNCGNICKQGNTGCVNGGCQYPPEVCNGIDDDHDDQCNEGCNTVQLFYEVDYWDFSSNPSDMHYFRDGGSYNSGAYAYKGLAFRVYRDAAPGLTSLYQCRVSGLHYLSDTVCPQSSVSFSDNTTYYNELLGYFLKSGAAPSGVCASVFTQLISLQDTNGRLGYTIDPATATLWGTSGFQESIHTNGWYVPVSEVAGP